MSDTSDFSDKIPDQELFNNLLGVHDDDRRESSDDELNDEKVMECERVADNNNKELFRKLFGPDDDDDDDSIEIRNDKRFFDRSMECERVANKTNNGTEESSEESIDLSSTSEDSIGSNRPPSPFPRPLRGSLIMFQSLKQAHKINAWRIPTKSMVEKELHSVEELLRYLKEAYHDWVHASGQAYIDRAYQSMFEFGCINGKELKAAVKMVSCKRRELQVRIVEINEQNLQSLESANNDVD
jgi:hypothetical protein